MPLDQLLLRRQGLLDLWTAQDFTHALQAAADGNTEELRFHLHREPFQVDSPIQQPLACHSWEELSTAVASVGHLATLKAVQAVNQPVLERSRGLFTAACTSGEAGLSILQWLLSLDMDHPIVHSEMLAAAARGGQLGTLQWLQRADSKRWDSGWNSAECAKLVSTTAAWQQLRASPPQDVHAQYGSAALCTLAAEMQDMVVLDKLLAAQPLCPFDTFTAVALARTGQPDGLKMLHEVLPDSTAGRLLWSEMLDTSTQAAANAGQLGALQWLWSHPCPSQRNTVAQGLQAVTPSISDSRWPFNALSSEYDFPGSSRHPYRPLDRSILLTEVSKAAIKGGHANVLEWLWDKCPATFWQRHACKYAASKQSAPALRWLLARDPPCPWESGRFRGYNALNCIWEAMSHHSRLPSPSLLEQIPVDDACACRQAAASGNLELLCWLQSRGCPQDERACNMAARNGHLDVLKYLRNQQPPCAWTQHTSTLAMQHGQPDTLLWLLQQGCPAPDILELASDVCIGVLVQRQLPLPPAVTMRASALGLLSTPLVVGLARWQRKSSRSSPEPMTHNGPHPVFDAAGPELLQELANLPEDIVFSICGLAGMCMPIQHLAGHQP